VRKIHDQWWNLNSIFTAPEPLSAFYLSAFLGSLQEQGYTIFVVAGPLPPSQPPASEAERAVPGTAGRWFSPEEARAATQVGGLARAVRGLPVGLPACLVGVEVSPLLAAAAAQGR
jgi:ataxin-3